ncbi:SulP family inorganic anion transporter [Streptomyces sp. NPDC060194]|uniref:SulP family inorganic anion transporter n=1 Tax=Streptomyces sp. NPDC060194 TaxID=3347069 RepID=UPI003655C026
MSACAPETPAGPHPPTAPPTASPPSPRPPKRRHGLPRISGADVSASVAVFLIALPLSLGIALATGAPLQAGLVAAAVGGLVAGRLGGSALQISGAATGLTVVTADLIQVYGWRTTCALTVLAGVTQLVLSWVRVARSALVVSPAIVHGMLAGIGVTIAVAQLHIVLGGSPRSSVLDNVRELPAQLAAPHPAALGISALTLLLLFAWPKVPGRIGRGLGKIPAALAAVAGATAVASLAGLALPRADLPSWRSHALPSMPEGPVLGLVAAVLTVTLVGSVESLLSAVAVDKLVAARKDPQGTPRIPRADLDKELRGQGVANIVSGALGGLPIAGGAVRSTANVRAGAVSRHSTMLHGVWIVVAALFLVPLLGLIPLAALAALVMAVGIRMVSLHHIRTVTRHREALVYGVTLVGVVLVGVLEGVGLGIATAVVVALYRLTRTRISCEVDERTGAHRVKVRGQLTFLAVPRLTRALHQIPYDAPASVELDGSFMDHAAYETLHDWQTAHAAPVEIAGRPGSRVAEPAGHGCCRPWTPWRNHSCEDRGATGRAADGPAERAPAAADRAAQGQPAGTAPDRPTTARPAQGTGAAHLASGISAFQRDTAPLVRGELARLAREGQQPTQLFLTCADSRLVTSMITSSGPGDLFVVRNVGNLVPPPGADQGDDSVAAAIEYAVEVLKVSSITVCGHSGCGAMQALLGTPPGDAGASTPLRRWLRHGLPSLERMAGGAGDGGYARLAGRSPADAVEQLCLTNVVQQLHHLRAHDAVARALAEGRIELHGMYFHVGEAQAYLLDGDIGDELFDRVAPEAAPAGA